MTHWTAARIAGAQTASGAAWRQRAAEILANHQPVLDRHDSIICKLCGTSVYDHGIKPAAAAPAEQEAPLSPEEEEMLF